MTAIIAKKIGMTQLVTEDGTVIPVTAVEAGPCYITGIRTVDDHGYSALQLAFNAVEEKRLNKPELGHLKKAGAPPSRNLAEFCGEVDEEAKIGDQVLAGSFEKGQKVKISGRSKGKGFQGTIKRHGFSRGPVSHGSHNVRAPGSIGASATPSRVFPGQKMPGQMGANKVTQRGIEIADVLGDQNVLLLKGSLPGPNGTILEISTDG